MNSLQKTRFAAAILAKKHIDPPAQLDIDGVQIPHTGDGQTLEIHGGMINRRKEGGERGRQGRCTPTL